MRDRVLGHVELKLGRRINDAVVQGARVRLATVGEDGAEEMIDSDRLIMATGYKVDLSRLDFLDKELLGRLRMAEGTPVLSADYESSVPGLHFVGLASAASFGPVMRFVVGARHPAPRLGRLFAKSLLRRPVSAAGSASSLRDAADD